MKKGRLVFVERSGTFITVESPAAIAKRQRKERETAEKKESLKEQQSNVGGVGSGGGSVSRGMGVSGRAGVAKSRRKGFSGSAGLYYLLAAIEFVETS